MTQEPYISVILPAGGSGQRYHPSQPKLLAPIHGKPVIYHTVAAFYNHPAISEIIIPCTNDLKNQLDAVLHAFCSKYHCVPSGRSRALSVASGYHNRNPRSHYVLIHDAARPNVSANLITRVIAALHTHKAVIPGIPVTDTLKNVANGWITHTVDRSTLVAVQTPQGFHADCLATAYATVLHLDNYTDEASLVEACGTAGKIIAGEPTNIKLTVDSDRHFLEYVWGHSNVHPDSSQSHDGTW
jgi:2-C-methyl-D-erythritol 4-phosphate cytidylyltransferase